MQNLVLQPAEPHTIPGKFAGVAILWQKQTGIGSMGMSGLRLFLILVLGSIALLALVVLARFLYETIAG